jgi:hypothetical protein
MQRAKAVKDEEMTPRELDAYLDAKAPWVPAFVRLQLEKLLAKRLGVVDGTPR